MRFGWAWVGFSLLAFVACSSGDDGARGESPLSDSEAFCASACRGWRRCGISGADCDEACSRDYESYGYRPGVLEKFGECLASEDCEVLAQGDGGQRCWDSVQQAEPLNQVAIDYCEWTAKDYFECNIWVSVYECIDDTKLIADEVFDRALDCHAKECPEISDCETAVFDEVK